MAVEPSQEQAQSGDFQSHVRDYSAFLTMFKWGAILSFVTAIVVMMLISN